MLHFMINIMTMIKRVNLQVKHIFDHSTKATSFVPHNTINLSSEQSTNDYIQSLCFHKRHREAIEAFDFVENNTSFRIRPPTYGRLICACSSLRSLDDGTRIHRHMVTSNCQMDVVLHNHVLNMYGKCGSVKDALKVFDEMPVRNVVSWTSAISGCSQNGHYDDAVDLYIRMRRSGIKADEFTFGSVAKACSGIGVAWLGRCLHGQVIRSDIGDGLVAQNSLVAMYTEFGRVSDAYNVFSMIGSRDLVSWGSMIKGFVQLGYESEALSLFKEMLRQGVFHPNEYIFGSAFNACCRLIESKFGHQIHGLCTKYGLGRNVFAGCSLCDMYAKCGFLEYAKSVFDHIVNPDLVSWNAIMSGFSSSKDPNETLLFFTRMRHEGLRPNDMTFLPLLSACSNLSDIVHGRQVHSCLMKAGFDSSIPVCNSLITMYAKCSVLSDAFRVFNLIRTGADLVSWNSILTACAVCNEAEDVFGLFRKILLTSVRPDHVTLSNVVSACSAIASLNICDQVHLFSTKTGLVSNILVANGLIDIYTKCGALETARKVFSFVQDPNVVSWSSLIVGYAQLGDGREALELFEAMQSSGVKPNEVTLVGVLTACSHVGLVEEGLKIYQTMWTKHGVVTTRQHCSCIVDILARSGRLKEAEDFIDQMPFEPDIVIWKTLLAASRTRGNITIGKRAAENVVNLDPTNSTAHVLLSSIHASSGGWEDFATLRGLMKEKGVRKVPGMSWVEIKGSTHVFFAEDTLHPEREKVYETLQALWVKMMEEEDNDLLEPVLCTV